MKRAGYAVTGAIDEGKVYLSAPSEKSTFAQSK
jgi:hypothetical protein